MSEARADHPTGVEGGAVGQGAVGQGAVGQDPAALAAAIVQGDRRSLARAITLVESTRSDHREQATALLDALDRGDGRNAGNDSDRVAHGAFRIGLSGTPGVGKSTFIESFGLHLCDTQHLRVAVIAVDPSSTRTGGSILGDKTRMAELARHPNAFIRPSPSGGTLGGVARRTREVIALCDAAGFDVVLVETVGVGQSEIAVAGMTDAFVLLVAPAGGDELQGIKRGIMELADLLVVNKCDGSLEAQARATLADYTAAMRLLRPASPNWTPESLAVSALTGLNIPQVWDTLLRLREALTESGELDARRRTQRRQWLWSDVQDRLLARAHSLPEVAALEEDVVAGRVSVAAAASRLLRLITGEGEVAGREPA